MDTTTDTLISDADLSLLADALIAWADREAHELRERVEAAGIEHDAA